MPPDFRTIIISGPPRSGTSLIAAMARAAGLWLGDAADAATGEDGDIAQAIEPHPQALRRAGNALRNFRHPALALRGVDVELLKSKISVRNARFARWGFKRPNVVRWLGQDGFNLFRNPRLIMMTRDPAESAERIATAHTIPPELALYHARNILRANMAAVHKLNIPTMQLHYEQIINDRDNLLAGICDFCGLTVPAGGFAAIKETVEAAGRLYRRASSGHICGHIDRYSDGFLSGWCRVPGQDRSVTVNIHVDDVMVASVCADIFRRDVHTAYRFGRHGFSVPLDIVNGESRVRAFIAGTDLELENGNQPIVVLARS